MEEIIEILNEFSLKYDEKAKELLDTITENINKGVSLNKVVLQSYKETGFKDLNSELVACIVQASILGYGREVDDIEDTLLSQEWIGGVTLAERIKELDRATISLLNGALNGRLMLSKLALLVSHKNPTVQEVNSILLSLNYLNSIEVTEETLNAINVLKRVKDAVENGEEVKKKDMSMLIYLLPILTTTAIGLYTYKALREPIRNNYMRLANTESARAWFEGFYKGIKDDDTVFGVKWKLSPRHPEFDICDVYANADMGFGKGVYPKGKIPQYPAHPHCICKLEKVNNNPKFMGNDFSEKGVDKYLSKLSDKQLSKLFTQNKLENFKNSKNWQDNISYFHGYKEPKIRS